MSDMLPLFHLQLGDRITVRHLFWLETLLFGPFPIIGWKYKGLSLTSGLAKSPGGTVYLAVAGNRLRIVKLPARGVIQSQDEQMLQEIDREYEVGRKLAGIRGVPAYEEKHTLQVKVGGRRVQIPVLVVEKVEGESLRSVLCSPGKLNIAEKLSIFGRLVDTLCGIHDRGIVHKDLNPENILVRFSQSRKNIEGVWLIDFGASMQERRFVCQYGSPEQHMPLAYGKVTQSSDIFSLGLVMYELLEGKLPFVEQLAAKAIAKDQELDLSFRNCLEEAIQNIIRRMLKKDPEKRFHSMQKIYGELLKTIEFSDIVWDQ